MKRLWIVPLLLTLGGTLWGQSPKILPERFLRTFDPVTVQFGSVVGPEKGGPADGPTKFLSIEGAPAGEYYWIDGRTLQFMPAEPWTPLRTVVVKAGDASQRLATLLAPPVAVSPASGSRGLEPIRELSFVFDRPLPLAELRKLVRLEVRPLPGLRDNALVSLADGDFSVRELETRQGSRTTYLLELPQPIGYGNAVSLVFRLSSEAGLSDTVARFSYETKAPFSLTALGAGSVRLPVSASGALYREDQAITVAAGTSLSLDFSEPLAGLSLETLKSLVSFTPSVQNLDFRTEGSQIVLKFDAARQTPYRISLKYQPLISTTGRVLSPFGATEATFSLPKADPYLQWSASEGLLERFGPQYLPMQGRAVGKVDLRVYPIDPLDRTYWPYPNDPVVVDETVRPPQPGREPAEGSDIVNHIRLLSAPPVSRVVALPTTESSGSTRFGLDLSPYLAEVAGTGQPGTYLVGYRPVGVGTSRSYVRVTVTDLSLSAVEEDDRVVFTVTSVRTGLPLKGATISVDGTNSRSEYVSLWSGETDADGMIRYVHRDRQTSLPKRVTVRFDKDTLVVDAAEGLPEFGNNHWSRGEGSWLSWWTSRPAQPKHQGENHAYLLSERPIYKPNETVHLVGWIKFRNDGLLLPYRGGPLELWIHGPGEKSQWSLPVTPNAFGRYSADFDQKDIPTGEYVAELRTRPDRQTSQVTFAAMTFRIEAYRVPTFQVDLSGPDLVALDRPFEVLLTADYYSGGRLVAQPVKWTVNQYPYSISSPSYQGFLFSTDERFSSGSSFGNVGSGTTEDELDETGAARLSVNPSAEPDGRARRYVITGAVSGADRQTVTQVKQVVALPPFSLGLKLDKISSGTLTPQFLVLGPDEKPKAGVPFTVRVLQRQWHSYLSETDFTTGEAKYATDVVDVPVSETAMTSTSGPISQKFAVTEAGVYVIEVVGRDYLGRQVLVRSDTFLPGDTPVAWARQRDQVFELSPDKKSYNPGDTAKILIKSPFQEARALVVIERPKENEYRWVPVKNGQAVFELRIEGDMAPNLPLAVLLMRGRIGVGTDGLDLLKPASVGGSLSLAVSPKALQGDLQLTHAVKALPATTLHIDLKFADPDGKALEGEAVLWLVDKAVLSLAKEQRLDPLPEFLPGVRSWIRISDLRNLFLGRLPVEEVPGGDGSEEAMFLEMLNKSTVRKNFKTVPYFNPAITVTNGKAAIDVDLPDNLTDFAVRAVAVTANGRMAVAKSVVSVRLPVLVQSALPRFLRPGDETNSGGIGRVTEGKGGNALTGIQVKGLTVDGKAEASRSFVLDDVKASTLNFPIQASSTLPAGSPASVSLFMKRLSDGASDAMELDIPIQPDIEKRVMTQTLTVSSNRPKPLDRPLEAVRPGSLEHTFLVGTDARLISFLQGLPYLADYAFGCLEQRTSKLYPAVLFAKLESLTGLPGAALPSPDVWNDYLDYLASCRDSNNLWSLWPGGKGSVFLSAYVLEFLADAGKAGLKVPDTKPTADALSKALRSDSQLLVSQYADFERVEALVALAAVGRYDQAYASELLTRQATLTLYSQARLYTLATANKLSGSRVDQLARALRASLVLKTVAGKDVFEGLAQSWSFFTPVLLTENRSLSAVTVALKGDTASAKARDAVIDWLLTRAGSQGWGSTIDTVSGLRALVTTLGEFSSRDAVNYTLTVGTKAERRTLTKSRVAGFTLRSNEPVTFTVDSATAQAPFTVFARSRYLPAALGDKAAATNKGFAVTREWMPIGADNAPAARVPATWAKGWSVPVGTVVEEHVHVAAFGQGSYVAIRIPLAAGFEPLNPALATLGPEAKPTNQHTRSPSYSIYGDDAVTLFFDSLPQGDYDFYFRVRANFEGSYTQPQAKAVRMYEEDVYGTSEGSRVEVTAAP